MPDAHPMRRADVLASRDYDNKRWDTMTKAVELKEKLDKIWDARHKDPRNTPEIQSLGTLLDLLANEDRVPLPVLGVQDRPVRSDVMLGARDAALGSYGPTDSSIFKREIKLEPVTMLHRYAAGGDDTGSDAINVYRTLLHEAAHARGITSRAALLSRDTPIEKTRGLHTEQYANDFADSLLRARGLYPRP